MKYAVFAAGVFVALTGAVLQIDNLRLFGTAMNVSALLLMAAEFVAFFWKKR